jgi:hypothetical protein
MYMYVCCISNTYPLFCHIGNKKLLTSWNGETHFFYFSSVWLYFSSKQSFYYPSNNRIRQSIDSWTRNCSPDKYYCCIKTSNLNFGIFKTELWITWLAWKADTYRPGILREVIRHAHYEHYRAAGGQVLAMRDLWFLERRNCQVTIDSTKKNLLL